ncbi:MAG TPA: L,D-transpeptidase family protein [Thermoanaerobaculia bacterium]|nr:L,D-transpeptidase family protein [Thermoanaerobaculia bacterium]
MHWSLVAFAILAQTITIPPATPVAKALEPLVEVSRLDDMRWPDFTDYRKHLRNFYAPRAYAPAWLANGRPTPQAMAVIAILDAADAKGINAVDYDSTRWPERIRNLAGANADAQARFDLALSASLMRYISDLHIGRINPRNLRFDLDIETKKYYLPRLLDEIAKAADPHTVLDIVEPPYDEYRRLQAALLTYRRLAAESAMEKPLPEVKSLKPGDAYDALPQLAQRLRRLGDLKADVDTKVYGGALADAVKRFQARHGLAADGVLSAKTFKQLNVPLGTRARQIEWALERWRWAPADFDRPPIVVNIPEFILRAWSDERGKVGLSMPVVVGQAFQHQTPVFEAAMRYLVFRPYWNVPPTIQSKELVPHAAKDPNYLERNGYELVSADDKPLPSSKVDAAILARLRSFDLSVRQKPGPNNALGLVKFMFPNQNNVYLHSTPSQELFSRSRRDFSHGCVRVENPTALAAWVLREQPQWTPEKIKAAMNGKEPAQVNLRDPIPVLIIYTTVTVDDDGTVRFFEDIYGHDAALQNALAAGYPYPG